MLNMLMQSPPRRAWMTLLVAVVALVPTACGQSKYSGFQTLTGKHSGGILVDTGEDMQAFCSGTLIAPGVVLTAAHCLKFPPSIADTMDKLPFYFQLGHMDGIVSSGWERIANFVVHPDYVADFSYGDPENTVDPFTGTEKEIDAEVVMARCSNAAVNPNSFDDWFEKTPTPEMLDGEERFVQCLHQAIEEHVGQETFWRASLRSTNDIAIAFLARDIDGSIPARLPSATQAYYDAAEAVTVAGYGLQRQCYADEPIVGEMHETQSYMIYQNDFEILLDNGATTACQGDSGGGVIRTRPEGLQLEGVTVRAAMLPLSGRCHGKVAATKVAAYLPWIRDTVAARGKSLP